MQRSLVALWLAAAGAVAPALAAEPGIPAAGHYLMVWTGDRARTGNDFLAVIDADPASSLYGRLVTTVATDQQTVRIHHTEYTMPASSMLFANDHDVGRSFIFDVRDPRAPKVAASFSDMAGFSHPHSFVRLPALDRVVSTNSSMHDDDLLSGVTYQVWRLSDLKLLKTAYFDVGANHYAQLSPEEPRLGPDGSIFVQALGCGIERITQVDRPEPRSQLVHTFPGNWCGVPTIVGHYLVQSVPALHGFVVLDITSCVTPEDRTYLLKLDQASGALSVDTEFRDVDGKPGFSFAERDWPHGCRGVGAPHGAVFTR